MKRLKAGQWIGSYYVRNKTTDKWKNRYKTPTTLRNTNSGYIITEKGTFVGVEIPKKHHYGQDPTKIKKPKKFQTRQQKKIMLTLRKKGRL